MPAEERKGSNMESFSYVSNTYDIDAQGFLVDYDQWDENFAEGMASRCGIAGGLTDKHWCVIQSIRDAFQNSGECPLFYKICKSNGLSVKDFKELFPTGYMRGACRLAGITHRDRIVNYYGEGESQTTQTAKERASRIDMNNKVYRVDVFGFLVDPDEWDEDFAVAKALEMKMPGGLTKRRREVIRHLRDSFEKNKVVPTVIECCEANNLEIEELAALFPDGYQRGAVKIAGLRVA
jgi:TusE/DsrC/DsvC family sulfur relay protein